MQFATEKKGFSLRYVYFTLKRLNQDQNRRLVDPDFGPNYLQNLSADAVNMERVK